VPRYRRRPQTVEAVQWFPGRLATPATGAPDELGVVRVFDAEGRLTGGYIPAEVSTGGIEVGDWTIVDSEGHRSVMDPEAFEREYEPTGRDVRSVRMA